MPHNTENLRALESVMLRMRDEGLQSPEIGKRIGKKPGTVDRIFEMIEYKAGIDSTPSNRSVPNALERTIQRLRARGESYGEIGNRLGRSGRSIRRIEHMADMRSGS